jgi:hypothetical protein
MSAARSLKLSALAFTVALVMFFACQSAPGYAADPPDFIVASIVADPVVPPPGQSVNMTVTIENVGGSCVGCFPFSVDFYKNMTTAPPPGASGSFGCQVSPPAPGATTTCSGTVSYNTEGSYSMWARVDTYNSVGESDETNNVFGPQSISVAYPPDLLVQSIAVVPQSPLAGQPVDVTVTIRNASRTCVQCPTTLVDFYKALQTQPGPLSPGDVACTVNQPVGGETVSCTGLVTYPNPGTFQMWAQVDRLNQVYEASDANNMAGPQPITVRPDSDGDAIEDASDNCPNWANPAQNLPPWPLPAGDADCDGFPDTVATALKAAETTIGTDPLRHCDPQPGANDDPPPDAWPPDFNDNQLVNGSDWVSFNPRFGARSDGTPGQGGFPYNIRWDLNANGLINGADMLQLNPFMFNRCA